MPFSMKTALALTATTILSNAAVLPRQGEQWDVTDFTVGSRDGGPTFYQLNINVQTQPTVECQTQNSVPGTVCAGQNGPAPFPLTSCGEGGIAWELFSTTSPTYGGGEAFFIQFREVGETETLYACSPLFSATNTTCESPTVPGETLYVPSSFSMKPSGDSTCEYV